MNETNQKISIEHKIYILTYSISEHAPTSLRLHDDASRSSSRTTDIC